MSAKQLSFLDDHDTKNPKQLPAPEHELIDQRLKHLKEDVLPFYPFLLTVPSDAPFRLGNRIINDWAVGTDGPFTPEEQQLQYMTFLTHHEGDSLLVAVGDWSDEAENLTMDHPGPQSAASVTPPSPPGGLSKKRISLNDYKNKRKNDTTFIGQDAGGDASTPHAFDPKQRVPKANSAENDSTRKQPDRKPSPSPARTAPMSRKHPYESQQEQPSSPNGRHSETTAKRRRLSPKRATAQESTDPQHNKLPDLLSPTLPPAPGGPSLPRLLSPTLPPDIEKELARFGGQSPVLESSRARNTPGSTLPKGNAPKKFSRNSPYSDGTRRLSGIQGLHGQSPNTAYRDSPTGLDRTRNGSPEVPKADIPSRKRDNSDPALPSEISRNHLSLADLKANRRPSQERPQLILRLKYGRSNRKRVDGLLKFTGKRMAAQPISPSRERGDLRSPQIKKEGQDYPRLDRESRDGANSRPREHSKEDRTSASKKKPPTPASVSQPPTSAPPEPGKARKTPAVSVKDPKGPTPRTESADSDDRAPISQAAKSSREFGATANQSSPHHGGQKSRPQDSERRAWTDEFHRFSNLGRELKHAAQREHQAAKEGGATSADEKRAVATSIEAILCFILAFVADDQSRALARQAGESSKWLSILAYWRVVKGNSRPYPALRSLCYMLGGVSYDAIHALDLERLAVSPIPGEHIAAPTPGSDGDTVVSDESRKTMKEFLDLKNRLPEFYKESHRLWLEGLRGLSEDILASELPSTWSRRSRNYSERGRHQLKVGDYSGEFSCLSLARAPLSRPCASPGRF
ncbi:hypothetical protein PHISP_03706 [Aspergillus sp. HF37]|nr:hypothetical protein PHISP_03706 [Aspergillus sp. HF37]